MKTNYKIALLAGDGVGSEIMRVSRKLIEFIGGFCRHSIELTEALVGGAAIDAGLSPMPNETFEICKAADAILLVAVGGPKWEKLPVRPERALKILRGEFKLYANLRPILPFPELKNSLILSPKIAESNIDIMIVRELTGDVYYGMPRGEEIRNGERVAFNTMIYSESEIRRIARVAMNLAKMRRKKVCSVDKANALEVSRLWRKVVSEVSEEFPDIELTNMYVDNAAMQLIKNPQDFDVLLTGNIFGDILSDEASVLAGSIGMLPSASIGDCAPSLYEPIHGSAPDIAGQDKANPIATILSIAMMYRYSFGQNKIADAIYTAVAKVLQDGFRTFDIMECEKKLVGCRRMGELVIEYLRLV